MLQKSAYCFLVSLRSSFVRLQTEKPSNWSRTFAAMAPSRVSKASKPRVIYWFRTDLRLHDSPALKAALDLDPEVFYPIWTWDPHYVYRARVGPNRWQFL
jgi:DNA photolyase